MPNYRRAKVAGGTYFFTVVTNSRQPFLEGDAALSTLGDCLRECQQRRPFTVDAIVVLPDHLHAIWSLPSGDDCYSARWAWIKKEFTKRRIAAGVKARSISSARHRERRGGIWQPRFWEHTIDSEDDFDRHFDYIHFNPVKHGLVTCPHEWRASSFHRWVKNGVYEWDWACGGGEEIACRLSALSRTTGEVD